MLSGHIPETTEFAWDADQTEPEEAGTETKSKGGEGPTSYEGDEAAIF